MISFLITFFAGISTVIGFFFIFIKREQNDILVSSLSFASGVMFIISLLDLIPEALTNIGYLYVPFKTILIFIIFFIIGTIISTLIDKYLPDNNYSDSKLYRVGMISMLAIILHNIPEGIATYITSNHDLKLGISLAISIALHNIPEGIGIAVPLYFSTHNKFKAFIYTFISGMSEFLGAIIACLFLSSFSNDLFMGCLYAIIAGIMIHISIFELLPSSLNYQKKFKTILFFILGIVFMSISLLILH